MHFFDVSEGLRDPETSKSRGIMNAGVYLKLLTGSILSYWHLSCTCNYLFFNRLIFGKWHLCLDNVFPVSRGLPQKKKNSEYQGNEASAGRKDGNFL